MSLPAVSANNINFNLTDNEKQIKKYETLLAVAKTTETAGVALTIFGIIGAGVFFSIPVVSTALAITGLLVVGPFAGHRGGIVLSNGVVHIWRGTTQFFYNAKVATTAVVAAGLIMAVGVSLSAIGQFGEAYCNRKIQHLQERS